MSILKKLFVIMFVVMSFICSGCSQVPDTDDPAELIAYFEGFEKNPYQCAAEKWTIGYGCTRPDHLSKGVVTESEARQCLEERIAEISAWLRKDLGDDCWLSLRHRQRMALVSLVYNIGTTKFYESDTRLAILAGNDSDIRKEWAEWRLVKGEPCRGLERRREAELSYWFGE